MDWLIYFMYDYGFILIIDVGDFVSNMFVRDDGFLIIDFGMFG